MSSDSFPERRWPAISTGRQLWAAEWLWVSAAGRLAHDCLYRGIGRREQLWAIGEGWGSVTPRPRNGDELGNANLSGRGNNDSDCGSARSDSTGSWVRWNICVSSADGDRKTARTDQRETPFIRISHLTSVNLTGEDNCVAVRSAFVVPLLNHRVGAILRAVQQRKFCCAGGRRSVCFGSSAVGFRGC